MHVAVLLGVLLCSPAQAAFFQNQARELLKKGDYSGAIRKYAHIAGSSSEAGLVAEYSYALALAGFPDASLAQLDRAFIMNITDEKVLYFGSKVLSGFGLNAAAKELARPPPSWLAGKTLPIKNMELTRQSGDFKNELASANLLMTQKRYASAAVRLSRLARDYPEEPIAWTAYAIALEQIGAYKTAARALEKDLELSGDSDLEAQEIKVAHQKELEQRPRVEPEPSPKKLNEYLKGRYLSFMGGSLTGAQGNTLFNLNGRLGKFFTNRFEAALNAGAVTGNENNDFNGISLGFSGRYHRPLPVALPLNGTGGARLEYAPGPSDNLAFILSPGLSYFLKDSSIDLYLDLALSGPLKNTQTLSLGYTVYFGGRK